ncbi:MAG: DAK2 domain-containing protein [Acholeplasmataceae bacterium]
MHERTLTNETLYNSFILGAQSVIREKNNLNAINVFPVADGDTGTNLASMMSSIIENSRLGETIEDTMQSIADAAITGARGNSGLIFAEYINGFAVRVRTDRLSIEDFIKLAIEAANNAYKAIAKPVEGTIITLMRAWASALERLHKAASSIADLLTKAYEFALVELAKTTDKLAVLKQNKVVDAGAKGFIHFVDGFARALKGEKVEIQMVDEQVELPRIEHLDESETRYCTEALIKSDSIDTATIRKDLERFGDSLVITGNKRTLRVHVHTNHPDRVYSYLSQHGHLAEQKVDDMHRQMDIVNNRKYRIALVTDSIADLPQSLVDEYQVNMYPLNLLINDSNYYDKLTIQSARFYEMMDSLKTYPTSSQPNPKDLENFFSFLTSYYDRIVVLTVSSRMSGTYQSFMTAAKSFPNHDIRIVDSKQNSGAEGLLVLEAAKLISQDKSIDEVVAAIEAMRERAKILVSVQTLKYMVRSGRVKKVTGLIGKILNLKPVISIDSEGNGIIFDKSLSIRKSNRIIEDHVRSIQELHGIESYAIVHANAKDRADAYRKKYTEIIGKEPAYVMDISTIVAMSAGIGTVAIAYIRKDDRDGNIPN